ncbi:peptidyl-tRNA hydrolase 2, mitochondrial-like [Watersipora subatra]|uniref:peptidyl-tRNA hydrolase 2, mitochondrial-like n=1 Tax=Watersipora subatra TaxID=2589382 RepID=UPI00355B1B40
MATSSSNLKNKDSPAPPIETGSQFILKPEQELLVSTISDHLQVHPSWVQQGLYFSLLLCPQPEGEELKAEASAWVLENHPRFTDEDDDDDDDIDDSMDIADEDSLFKMVFIVNGELQMSEGKIAAQVAHAAIDIYIKLSQNPQSVVPLQEWMSEGSKKIVTKCKDTKHFLDLKDKASNEQLAYAQVQDAGKTEVMAGAFTCLAIFGRAREVNKVTGSLQLL